MHMMQSYLLSVIKSVWKLKKLVVTLQNNHKLWRN